MAEVQLNPYIFFKGNAKEAMEFYQSVFGGDLTVQKVGEVPADALPPGANKDHVMHAALRGGAVTMMAADSDKASPEAKKIELSIGGKDEAQLRAIFDKLSAGGKVSMPLKKQFWGDIFGQVTDKYGIDWMVNVTMPGSQTDV
jgi:PhnB protein